MSKSKPVDDERWKRFKRRLRVRRFALSQMWEWIEKTSGGRYEGRWCRPIPSLEGAGQFRDYLMTGEMRRTAEDELDFDAVCEQIAEMFAEMEECDRREDERRGEKVGG